MSRLVCLAALVATAAAFTPNEKLKQCCASLTDADKGCVERFCDFDAISQTSILTYMSNCQSKGPTVGQMWDCASLRHDHTDCCKKAGVPDECMVYCNTTKGVPTNYQDYVFCTESFNEIRTCFHDHLDKNEPFHKTQPAKKGKGKGKKN